MSTGDLSALLTVLAVPVGGIIAALILHFLFKDGDR